MHTLSHAKSQKRYNRPGKMESHACKYCGMVFSYRDMLILHTMSRHKQVPINKPPLDLSLKTPMPMKRKLDEAQLGEKPSSIAPTSLPSTDRVQTSHHNNIPIATQVLAAITGSTSALSSMYKRAKTPPNKPVFSEPICKTEPVSPPPEVIPEPAIDDTKTTETATTSDTAATTAEQLTPSHAASTSADVSSTDYFRNLQQSVLTTSYSQSTPNWPQKVQENHKFQNTEKRQTLPTGKAQTNSRSNELYFCKHCDVIFLDRAMYNLHAGLHNCNSPLQCNICGKKCSTALEFAAHVIHN